MGAVGALRTESLAHFLKCHLNFLLEIRSVWEGGRRGYAHHPAYKQGILTNLGVLLVGGEWCCLAEPHI